MAAKLVLEDFPSDGRLIDGVSILIPKGLKILISLEPGIGGDDPEAVHDMRIISRRVRSLLEVSKQEFPPRSFKKLFKQVRDVTRTLGEVRNLEVAGRFFNGYSRRSRAVGGREAADWIIQRLSSKESKQRKGAIKILASMQLQDPRQGLLALWDEVLDETRFLKTDMAGVQHKTFRERATELIPELFGNVIQFADAVEDPLKIERLHLMRIAFKKLRYGIEALMPAFNPGIGEVYKRISDLQELTGEIHDRDIYQELVDENQKECIVQGHCGEFIPGFLIVKRDLKRERGELFKNFVTAYKEQGAEDQFRQRLLDCIS